MSHQRGLTLVGADDVFCHGADKKNMRGLSCRCDGSRGNTSAFLMCCRAKAEKVSFLNDLDDVYLAAGA